MAAPPITERHLHHFHRRSPIKESVRVATTANIAIATALNSGDVLDGITLATDDRVLVKDQTAAAENGLYVVAATPVRAYDQSTDDPAFGFLVYIREGTAGGGKLYKNTNTSEPTIGTTALTWAAAFDLGWFNVKVYGAMGNGVTDDTVAIQAAINAATTAGGGTIYFPAGVYIVGGALRDTTAFNGQLLLPNVAHTGVDHMVLTFRGALRPGLHPVYGDTVPVAAGLSVIKSTLAGATGTASVISGGNNLAAPSSGGGNNLEVNVEDLVSLAPDNPTFTFWNLSATQGGAIRALQISTPGGFAGSAVQPTNTNAYGIKLPQKYMSNYTETTGLSIGGFYTCLLNGERADHRGLILGICIVGLEQPAMFYASVIHSVQLTSFQYGIRASGGDSRLDVLDYSAEHTASPAWQVTVADLDDASNRIYGYIRHQNAVTGGTLDNTFTKNAGTNVLAEVKGPTWGGSVTEAAVQAVGHYELLLAAGSSPLSPLETGDGLDWLYVWVPA